MIRYLTGGDVCYDQPINYAAFGLCVLFGVIAYALIRGVIKSNVH